MLSAAWQYVGLKGKNKQSRDTEFTEWHTHLQNFLNEIFLPEKQMLETGKIFDSDSAHGSYSKFFRKFQNEVLKI